MNPCHKLDELKHRLDASRPLPPEVVRNLHEDTVLRWTYHSNAIEGNTLTLKETKVALEGITVGEKPAISCALRGVRELGHGGKNRRWLGTIAVLRVQERPPDHSAAIDHVRGRQR